MKISIFSVATFFLAAATSVTSAPLEAAGDMNQLHARQDATLELTVEVFSNSNFGGFMDSISVVPGKCRSLPKGIRDNVESARFPGGYRCTVYRQSDCQGVSDTNDAEKIATGDGGSTDVIRPFIKKLRILVRNHARSVRCKPL
ncbi:hypothetical protein TWF718_005119 [Orbilia javanica]|uniref:Uncharacterized protein n=1 Tax=Orbilia javanica TaxID=47235 RepID=A0AAN8RG25_9PEZI